MLPCTRLKESGKRLGFSNTEDDEWIMNKAGFELRS
jgi:hypothetical protein